MQSKNKKFCFLAMELFMLRFVIDQSGVDVVGVGKIGLDTSFEKAKAVFAHICAEKPGKLEFNEKDITDLSHGITVCYEPKDGELRLYGISLYERVDDPKAQTLELHGVDILSASSAQVFAAVTQAFRDSITRSSKNTLKVKSALYELTLVTSYEAGTPEHSTEPIHICHVGYST
jgi:hypothetical protein